MAPPAAGTRRRARPWRLVLLLAIVVALAILALVVTLDPARLGLSPGHPGRTVAPGELGWRRGAPAPVALTEVAATAHHDRVWVAGGLDADGHASRRVLVYDPASDHWSEGPRLLEGVHHAALVSDGDALYLIGGYMGDGFDGPTADVWRLDRGSNSWVRGRPLPDARAAGAASWDGRGRILYGGGVGFTGVSTVVFASDPASGWLEIARLGEAREHLAATSPGGGAVTFLGGRRADTGNLATIETVGFDGRVIRRQDVPTPRGGVAAFSWPALGDCLVGGEGPGGTFGDVECVGASSPTSLPGLAVPRHGLGAAVIRGRVYVVLGGPTPGLSVSDAVEILDLP